ncbi:MAG: TrmB family transcriptional regulator [Nanoarchaeota archaeon]
MDTKLLEEIGFSKGEIKVYFALIELNESTIGPLSKKSKITSAKVYIILEKLIKKGLASYVIKSGTKYFKCAPPEEIINYLDEKNKKIDEQKEELKNFISQIKSIPKTELKSVEIYEGFKGLRTIYNDAIKILKENKENFKGFSLGKEEYNFQDSVNFFKEYDGKRKIFGIKTNLLAPESQRSFMKDFTNQDDNIKIKFIPYSLPTGIIIYGNKVATINWDKEPTGFVINSKQIAQSYRNFFNDLWKIGCE